MLLLGSSTLSYKALQARTVAYETKIQRLESDNKEMKDELCTLKEQIQTLVGQMAKLRNGKSSEQEKPRQHKEQREGEETEKPVKALSKNCWDVNFCHEGLRIIGDERLTVNYKKNKRVFLLRCPTWRSVFAKYPILLGNDSSEIFYFEITVKNFEEGLIRFGFALKERSHLEGSIRYSEHTYAFGSDGSFYRHQFYGGNSVKWSYGVGTVVGVGVNLASRQIFFTKNGLRFDSSEFLLDQSSDVTELHPFVSLCGFGNEIEANFGPKFDLATL